MNAKATMAVRLDPDLHARAVLVAKLTERTLTDLIRDATHLEIARCMGLPEVYSRAKTYDAELRANAEAEAQLLIDMFFDAGEGPA